MTKVIRKNSIRTDTNSYTVKDLLDEIQEDRAILFSLGYDTSVNSYQAFMYKNNIHKLGNCHRKGTDYTISLNEDYVHNCKPEEIHNTIMHEVIHSVPGCMNHGYKWKSIADKVEKAYGFHDIETTNSWKDWEAFVRTKAKYVATCKKCGQKYYWYRKSKYYNLCKTSRGGCGICGCDRFLCEEF